MMKTIETKTNGGIETKCVYRDRLIVAEWFAAKKFAEKNRRMYDDRIFAIIGETEKAYNVVLGNAFTGHLTTWCPKSLVSVNEEAGENDMTFVCDYATAMKIIESEREYWS